MLEEQQSLSGLNGQAKSFAQDHGHDGGICLWKELASARLVHASLVLPRGARTWRLGMLVRKQVLIHRMGSTSGRWRSSRMKISVAFSREYDAAEVFRVHPGAAGPDRMRSAIRAALTQEGSISRGPLQ